MSRPRRFGKSLFLDTLKELFEGNQALFEGLHIHDRHDWSQRHPVVRLDFARGHFVEPGSLHANVHIGTEALLFQTGYLTITAEEKLGGMPLYRLGYPNREVRQSLNLVLLRHLVQDTGQQMQNSIRLARLLETGDCAGLRDLFYAFFAGIPYEWHTSNDIAKYEGYYASVFYSYFAALGYEISVEESSSHGRLDMAVRTGGHVYLFEFKVVEMAPPGSALALLRERRYADKYRGRGEPIHLIGVEISRETRNVTAFEIADG